MKNSVRVNLAAALALALCMLMPSAFAFKFSPQGTALEQSVAKKYSNWWRRIVSGVGQNGVSHFTEPVHEENSAFAAHLPLERPRNLIPAPDISIGSRKHRL